MIICVGVIYFKSEKVKRVLTLTQVPLAHATLSSIHAVNNKEQVILHFINAPQLCYLKFLSHICNK